MSEKKYVVTIARQFGSLGRPIARKLSEKLGIKYYDRDILDLTAKKLNMPASDIVELEESVQGGFFRMKYPLGLESGKIQDRIFETQKSIIKDLAEKESCIIVGRCADSILYDYDNSLHIFIYAPNEVRFETCKKEFGMEASEAKRMMLEVDKARERYHLQYAGFLPSDIRYKDLLVDSSVLGIDKTVDMLEEYIKAFIETDKPKKSRKCIQF
ncbi:MAG: cytidylate kinase-like family protein [Lachnospiraceae bacterium]|nr:cytidylate kinase-like family protein [Lachnospiraceae bacterium]